MIFYYDIHLYEVLKVLLKFKQTTCQLQFFLDDFFWMYIYT